MTETPKLNKLQNGSRPPMPSEVTDLWILNDAHTRAVSIVTKRALTLSFVARLLVEARFSERDGLGLRVLNTRKDTSGQFGSHGSTSARGALHVDFSVGRFFFDVDADTCAHGKSAGQEPASRVCAVLRDTVTRLRKRGLGARIEIVDGICMPSCARVMTQ